METNTHNIYLFKALAAYPYELEKAIEALNYALAYEPDNATALCLMARVQQEQLGDYEAAKEYYDRALASRMDLPEMYPDYIRLLVNNHDYAEAQKLIDFAFTVKGIDTAGIHLVQALLFEATFKFEEAENTLKEARQFGLNEHFIHHVNEVLSRVTSKREFDNNRARKQTETEKTEHEKETGSNSWFRDRLNNLL